MAPSPSSRWDPGKKLVLSARDDYWGGRAFLDSIEIEMGKSFREQMIALDLGKADLVEVAPDQARHAVLEGRRVESSPPAEWMGLVFTRDVQSAEDGKLREALALSIDRDAMNNVLLQGGGEPAGTLLPGWMSGYAFLFPTAIDLQRARQARDAGAPGAGVDAGLRCIRSAGPSHRGAYRTERARRWTDAANNSHRGRRHPTGPHAAALARRAGLRSASLPRSLGLPQPKFDGDPLQQSANASTAYAAESTLLQSQRVIPLLHLRTAVALGANVMGWREDPDGSWRLQDVWLETGKP